jgi:homeobox protein cut-like
MDAFATEHIATSDGAAAPQYGPEQRKTEPGPMEDTAALKGEDHQFQKAISTWKSIGFGSLVPQLDKTATDIVDSQKEAVVQRKELAQKTKDFRKLEDANKLSEIKTLLRAYQNFVDLLTNHQKTSASAFLQIYSSISEAPDPYPLLEASIDALLSAEDVPRLNAENERLQRSLREKTKSMEDLETQLQKERSLRKELETSRESKAQEIEVSWQAVLNESKENWEVKEKALEDKLENQERLYNEIKASLEVNQRLGSAGSNESTKASASAAELEIVSNDLERTSQRLAEVESRNEQLRKQLAQASSQDTRTQDIEDDPAYVRLRTENESLLRQLDSVKSERGAEERKWETQSKSTERDLQLMRQENLDLRDKLSKWKDYPELKRELDVFRVSSALMASTLTNYHRLLSFQPAMTRRMESRMVTRPQI